MVTYQDFSLFWRTQHFSYSFSFFIHFISITFQFCFALYYIILRRATRLSRKYTMQSFCVITRTPKGVGGFHSQIHERYIGFSRTQLEKNGVFNNFKNRILKIRNMQEFTNWRANFTIFTNSQTIFFLRITNKIVFTNSLTIFIIFTNSPAKKQIPACTNTAGSLFLCSMWTTPGSKHLTPLQADLSHL